MSDDLRQLVNCCIAGRQEAMLELVARFRGQVFGLCFRMLGHREDAEDAAQETFVRVLKNLARWDQQRDFEPWLFAIAGNRCRTMLASRRRKPAPSPLADEICDNAPDMQAARNLAEEVQLALQRLRDEYREAFVLFHEHEMNYDHIAEAMKRPLGTVKTWVHRARREMIAHLQRRGIVQDNQHALRRV